MSRKKQVIKKVEKSSKLQDTVVFMTAYNIHRFKHQIPKFWKKYQTQEVLNEFHISGISFNNVYISPNSKCSYDVEYNSFNQVSAFHFDESIIEINDNDSQFVEDMMMTLLLHHSAYALLDSNQINISMCFNMESFLVVFGEKVYQVDPVAFLMNDSLIVNFELIDFETSIPLGHDAIYGRSNNYGIRSISKIKYFNETEFSDDDRKISDIIFRNVFDFVNKTARGKLIVDNFSFVHNTLVVSNQIDNIDEYFQNVLGAQINNFKVDNISTTDTFEYYSTEFLGVVTRIIGDYANNILYDCMMLEAFKVYLLLKMIIDYQITHKLDKIVDSQIYVENLFYPGYVPIVTLNVINNLKSTISFSRYKEAIDFKVKALKIRQERQHTSNGRFMNILLYILAMLGSAQTLQVLQTEFGIIFKPAFWIVMAVFIIFGIVWMFRDLKK